MIRFPKLGIGLLLIFALSCTALRLNHCDHDGDCQIGQYCLHKKGQSVCANCEDCVHTFYKEARSGHCARNGFECGPCLPGFVEMPQANNQVGQRCSRNHTGNDSVAAHSQMPIEQLVKIIVPIVCVFALIGLIPSLAKSFRYVQRKRHIKESNEEPSSVTSDPIVNNNNQHSSQDTEMVRHASEKSERRPLWLENDAKTKATMFAQPNYAREDPIPSAPPIVEEPSVQESLLPAAILSLQVQEANPSSASNSSISLRTIGSEGSSSTSSESSNEDHNGTRRSSRRHQDLTLCFMQITTDEEIIER